jgi:hypothetical protein
MIAYLSVLYNDLVSKTSTQRRQISERLDTRQKEVSAASDRGESG